jgi:hypothetical protein
MQTWGVNLSTSIPSMFFAWSLTQGIYYAGYDPVPKLTLILMISLIFQGLFARSTFAFSNEIQIYSEELANNRIPLYLQSKVGSFLTVFFIVFSKYIIALFILLTIGIFSDQIWNINIATILCLVVIMGLLLDPILAFILRIDDSPKGDIMTVLAGYWALILISVGAISISPESIYYSIFLTFNILTTRMAFMATFAFDKREYILVFAPSVIALCITVLPKLNLILQELI